MWDYEIALGAFALAFRESLTVLRISPSRVHHFGKIPPGHGLRKRFSLIAKGLEFGLIAIPEG